MDCPRCEHLLPAEAVECPRCGVVLAKWKEGVREPRLLPPGERYSASPSDRFSGSGIVVWTLALIAIVGAVKLIGGLSLWDNLEPAEPAEAAREESRRKAATAEGGPDPSAGLERLEWVVRRIRAEGEPHGVNVSVDELQHWFEKGAAPLHPAVARHRGPEAGLPAPASRRFDEADRRHRSGPGGPMGTKCLHVGSWEYSDRMPATDDGVAECWSRLSGRRRQDTGSMVIDYGNGPIDSWERWVWQPGQGRWSPYSEHDEQVIMQYMLDNDYGTMAQHEDRQRSDRALDRALANLHVADEYRRSHIKQAILTAYETIVKREGLLYRMER